MLCPAAGKGVDTRMKRWLSAAVGTAGALLLIQTQAAAAPGVRPGEPAAAAQTITGGERLTLENERLALYAAPDTGNVRVVDKAAGRQWTSNPADAENDPVAKNIFRTNLRSQLLIEYIDDRGRLAEANSCAGSVMDGNLTVQQPRISSCSIIISPSPGSTCRFFYVAAGRPSGGQRRL